MSITMSFFVPENNTYHHRSHDFGDFYTPYNKGTLRDAGIKKSQKTSDISK